MKLKITFICFDSTKIIRYIENLCLIFLYSITIMNLLEMCLNCVSGFTFVYIIS